MYFIARGSVNGYQVTIPIRVEGDEDKLYSKAQSFAAKIFSDMSGIVDEVYVTNAANISALSRIIDIKCYFDFTE